jgi:hypothetical protein
VLQNERQNKPGRPIFFLEQESSSDRRSFSVYHSGREREGDRLKGKAMSDCLFGLSVSALLDPVVDRMAISKGYIRAVFD